MGKNNEIVEVVSSRLHTLETRGDINYPENYSAGNALRSAWLAIQETVDNNKQPALQVCTQVSIINAMLNTVIQGLNPAKQQCYYIVYGNKLVMQRSYFGTMQLAKSVNHDIKEIYAATIHEGQVFEMHMEKGRTIIDKHEVKFGDSDKPVVGAYCTVEYKDGTTESTVMTINEIMTAWSQSKMKPVDNGKLKAGSTHAKFTAEMAKKTVVSRACKYIINSSADSNLILNSVRETDIEIIDAEASEEIAENENSVPLDFNPDTAEITVAGSVAPHNASDLPSDLDGEPNF